MQKGNSQKNYRRESKSATHLKLIGKDFLSLLFKVNGGLCWYKVAADEIYTRCDAIDF